MMKTAPTRDPYAKEYNFLGCESLFGYGEKVHRRCEYRCQLCGAGGLPINFDFWRQLSVEHLIGDSQGGYFEAILASVLERFPAGSSAEIKALAEKIEEANTVTACGFCNSTTSRWEAPTGMREIIAQTPGDEQAVLEAVCAATHRVLEEKRAKVEWKIRGVRRGFDERIGCRFMG